MTNAGLPIEITILAWSVILLLVHVMLQGQFATAERGLDWNAGARDAQMPPLGPRAGRAERALGNFKETYPGFIAAVLAVVVSGRMGFWSEAGALLWIIARIVYVPLYLFGVPYVRSLAWVAAMLGIALILFQLLP